MIWKKKGRDAEFSVAGAKHCQVKQDGEWAYPQFMRITKPATNNKENNNAIQKKRKKMNTTNKSHKAFAIKEEASLWRLASPPLHTEG
jgi:hypothetical protein